MNKSIKMHRIIATFFLLIFFPTLMPVNLLYASNNGPNAPEASNFEPLDTTDMVNLATGDMNYVLPLLNVPSPEGGYPLVLSYHGGIAYDLESSWVGLGWNLNPGAIERGVNGYPDDWKDALIRTRNYYEFTAESTDIGVSVGLGEGAAIDIGVTFGKDSNGGKYGTINLGGGVKTDGGNKIGAGFSVGYHNKNGVLFNVGAGYQDESGVGVGGSIGTNGAGIGASFSTSLAEDDKGNSVLGSSLGISLNSNGISGSFSLSSGAGSSNFSINAGSLGETTETNWNVAVPLVVVPVWIKFGKRKIKFEKNETYANFVYGPLYYNNFNYQQGQGGSYSTELSNESNRDYFMDSYQQRLPETESEFVSYEDIYNSQKYDFTFPAYDSYMVNAQGLSGNIVPRLFESGIIVGKSQNYEQEDNLNYSGAIINGQLFPPVSDYSGGIVNIGGFTVYQYRTLESFVMNWNYNSSSRKFSKAFGTSINQNAGDQVRFYFENAFPSTLKINPSGLSSGTSNILNYIGSSNSTIGNRQQNANYVEAYTNKQLAKNISNPSQALSALSSYNQTGVLVPNNGDLPYNRIAEHGYDDDGIGAYKITTPDGKTYHYSMPVYQYEEVYRQLKKTPLNHQNAIEDYDDDGFFDENKFYQEQRKNQPYATHWLLTAVTGPDYFDSNNNGQADEDDYGYWVRFDYGKWTDGYCWRAPYTGFNDFDQFANYNSEDNGREYGWGRKQLAYLNKVVTRTHTAIMVKSLRHDSMSKEIGNEFLKINLLNGQPQYGYPSYEGDNGVYYSSQRTMKLDEIILVQNEYDNVGASTQVQAITSSPSETKTVNWHSPIVKNYSPSLNYVKYKINQQNLVIDNGDLPKDGNGNYLIYQKADRIIKLNQDYSLATNSPHSDAPANGTIPAKGRLTLKSIQNLGRNAFDYMPPTTFDYFNANIAYQECPNATCNIKNPWGYNNNFPQAWSLQKITTPTGAKLEFELEKDTYWTEAFSRRYWLEDLMFKVTYNSSNVFIDIENKTGSSDPVQNFEEYFMLGERTFLDLWISKIDEENCTWPLPSFEDIGIVDILGTDHCVVDNVTSTSLRLVANRTSQMIRGNDPNRINNNWFARGYNPLIGSQAFKSGERGSTSHNVGGCSGGMSRNHNMYYNLLANKVPGDGTGGGLRVKSITSIDEINNRYTTEYNYNHPTKNRTSGITSFAPVRGLKYVPYQTELPSPRVMYEYVTVREKTSRDGITNYNGKTIYRFNVLENATNIFDKNITVGNFFKSEVVTNDNLNPTLKVKGAQIKLQDNSAQLGSIISIESYNSIDQLIYKSFTKRKNLNELITSFNNNEPNVAVQESFQSMKSIHKFNSNYVKALAGANLVFFNYATTQKAYTSTSLLTEKRLLNSSSKIYYKPQVEFTEELDQFGIMKRSWQEDVDPMTGLYTTSISTQSDGKQIKNEIIPAYTKYPQMGSKVTNFSNKNMLTQEAMTITSVYSDDKWKTIDANITTWNDNWAYRNEDTGTDILDNTRKVWRKHKSFVWKEALDSDGAYSTTITKYNTQFNWGLGTPLDTKWQKVSEITRYNRWSLPLETKDINGNFASSKMADNNTKVIVSGNARYSEMYFSGAEHVKSGNLFDGEVRGASLRTHEVAHTGKYSVKASSPNDKIFEVVGSSGNANYYYNTETPYTETFRPGMYKVSIWAYNQGNPLESTQLIVNGQTIPVKETVNAGCWKQMNYYFKINQNVTNNSIYVKCNSINNFNYYDDFRMSNVSSSLNTFVYDEKTDELSYILDANNMATGYKYDNAGRLIATYSEIMDNEALTGGFKLLSQFKQQYKNAPMSENFITSSINNCLQEEYEKMNVIVKNTCTATFENEYTTYVNGGSGNFSYQYKWLTNVFTGQFTNFINGSNKQLIPYAAKNCSTDLYNKVWSVVVRVTDNVTGQIIEETYYQETEGCDNAFGRNIGEIEVSDCSNFCSPKPFRFKIHLKDISTPGNFKYEYAYHHPDSQEPITDWIDVTATNGAFCPVFDLVADQSCPSSAREVVHLAYRITNLTTGTAQITLFTYYGDCCTDCYVRMANPVESDTKYLKNGYTIYRDFNGKIQDVKDNKAIIK